MNFSYESYMSLIDLLKQKKYEFCFYDNWQSKKKSVILRHDIDQTIEKAYKMASLENSMGVSSTYFVMVSSELYNVFFKEK